MITKKCTVSLGVFLISLLLTFAGVHIMSLFRLSKWVGVSIGGVVLIFSFVIYFIFNKKWRKLPIYVIFIASFATGVTISSLFVLQGAYPPVWQSAVLYICFVVLFYIYCLFTNLSLFRNHYKLPLAIYSVIFIAASILLFVFLHSEIFILAIMGLIPFVAFLISLSADAKNDEEHIHNLASCTFGVLLVAVIVVLIVLSEGDGLDGFSGAGGSSVADIRRKNPYDYLYN